MGFRGSEIHTSGKRRLNTFWQFHNVAPTIGGLMASSNSKTTMNDEYRGPLLSVTAAGGCSFSARVEKQGIDPDVAVAKLESLADGAAIASERLF